MLATFALVFATGRRLQKRTFLYFIFYVAHDTDKCTTTMKKIFKLAVVALCMGFTMASCSSDDNKGGKEDDSYKKDLGGGIYEVNGQRFVDLGLPSGLLWAETNLGASGEAETGGYFAWGETASKTNFTLEGYKWPTYSKYNTTDNKRTLEASDDAATVAWKEPIRMPSVAEFDELHLNTVCTATTRTNAAGETVSGLEFKSKTNSNSIFMPFAGYYVEGTLYDVNNFGQYWSSNIFTGSEDKIVEDIAFYNTFNETIHNEWSSRDRYNGRSIRAVVK